MPIILFICNKYTVTLCVLFTRLSKFWPWWLEPFWSFKDFICVCQVFWEREPEMVIQMCVQVWMLATVGMIKNFIVSSCFLYHSTEVTS